MAALLTFAPSAFADDDIVPPVINTTTPTGVSLSDGSFIYNNTDISVGTLKLERFHMGGPPTPVHGFFGSQMSHNFDIYVSRNVTTGPGTIGTRNKPVVHIGASASGVFEQSVETPPFTVFHESDDSEDGDLNYDNVSGAYRYTAQDGTIYNFNPSVGVAGGNGQRVADITYPNGRHLDFTYNGYGRLKLISDNSGYALVFDYDSGGLVIDACGFNLADVYLTVSSTCDGASLKTSYTYVGTTTTVTDVMGNTTTLSYPGDNTSCIQPPGYSTCRVKNYYGNSEARWQVTQQDLSSGVTWHFVTPDDAAIRKPVPGTGTEDPTGGATVTDPLGNQETYGFSKTSPYSFEDADHRVTQYRFIGAWQFEWDEYTPDPPAHLQNGKFLDPAPMYGPPTAVTQPQGNGYIPAYGPYAAPGTQTYVAKPGSGLANIVVGFGFNDPLCTVRLSCTKPSSKTDPNGKETDYTYDTAGNLLTEMKPAPSSGAVRPLKVNTYVQMYANIKNSGGTLVPAATSIWMITSETDCQTAAASINTPTCDSLGPQTVKTYQYGASGTANNLLPVSVTTRSADGSLSATTAYTYTDQGDVASADGPLTGVGDQTFTTYDLMRRKVDEIGTAYAASAGGIHRRATHTIYDLKGPVGTLQEGYVNGLTSPSMSSFTIQNWTLNHIDAYGRVDQVSKQHTEGGSTVTTIVTQTTYDELDRVKCVAVRMNPATFASLPADACTLGTAGSFGPDRIVKNTYDPAGQLLTITKAYGTPLQQDYANYHYTPNGKQDWVIDANGNKTSYTYDGDDRLQQINFPSPTTPGTVSASDYESYTYDLAGNRLTLRKRDGTTIYYRYDFMNRLQSSGTVLADLSALAADCSGTIPSSVLTCNTYDYLSHVTGARSGNGSVSTSVYDPLGRKTTETNNGKAVGYQYDIASRRIRVTWPDSYYVTYDYDDSGHMTDAKENGSALLASYALDVFGRANFDQYGGSSTHAVSYDWSADDDLITLSNALHGASWDVDYTNSFTPSKQIASADVDNSAYIYPEGTAGTTNYTVNGLNQYKSIGAGGSPGTTCTSGIAQSVLYDCNGNLTSGNIGGGLTAYTFTYDPLNRLATAAVGGMTANYTYDALGRRTQKQVTGGAFAGTTDYLDSGDDEIAEYDHTTGNLLRRYIPGPAVDRPIALAEYTTGSEVLSFFYTDRQGSVVAMADSAGNKTEGPYTYSAYGQCIVSGGGACTSGVAFKYTGRRLDPETGLYYYRARYYAPYIGRFLQTDPVGYKDDLNWYAYVANDPMNKSDPSGEHEDFGWSGQYVMGSDGPEGGASDTVNQGNSQNGGGGVGSAPSSGTNGTECGVQLSGSGAAVPDEPYILPSDMLHIIERHGVGAQLKDPRAGEFLPEYATPAALEKLVKKAFQNQDYGKFGAIHNAAFSFVAIFWKVHNGQAIPEMIGRAGGRAGAPGPLTPFATIRVGSDMQVLTMFPSLATSQDSDRTGTTPP